MKQSGVGRRALSTVKKGSGSRLEYNGDGRSMFRRLPKVPMTKYLETRELAKDILYSGYRPVMYPVRENPLFRNSNKLMAISHPEHDTEGTEGTHRDSQTVNTELFGNNNCGGINTLGCNGTWKYAPKIPQKMLPFNWWSASSLAMEVYPEWSSVPKHVVKGLKPFDLLLGVKATQKK
ncbi:Sue1p KNAG_0A07960 [Huiozyma naganishii CBS 8797]|uniref:Uncharacterized protein n=1 Tax=Huiozyma naganishii (strain ATCC MYA-139 / BCRC 22969 / CBS 8797 / KCTC 17520 / NBRC 10181 / NCYC 3082 / Yp74L-3) TaxID=1071383 RepID=J7S315_HUIN7|nr:hypothetical protein KNAG_0A07960 [Kazachstania naganishii CBS 8797]CCK68449.1 hypothetical protein KNAG_0A07960 [Kazachstania naganishii CBS 8797]